MARRTSASSSSRSAVSRTSGGAKDSRKRSSDKRAAAQVSAVATDANLPRMVMMLIVLALTLLGFVMIFSASSISAIVEESDASSYLVDQVVFAAIGIIAAILVWKVFPYRAWMGTLLWLFWGVSVFLLLLTAATGLSALGAQRWVSLGFFSLQPSEFAKIAFILMTARLFTDLQSGQLTFSRFLVAMGLLVVAPIMLLFFSQSDLGTTAIIALGILGVMWFGEVPLRWIAGVVLALVLFAVLAIVTSGYRTDRMLYLNPWADGQNGYGAGYQIIHSFYAFSEGGIFGVGLGNSREKYLYLPESETDFIFAIIGEELGLIGALLVIIAFLVLLWAGLRIARACRDDFGRMVAGALTIMLVFQAFLNIGCVIGVFPTTGKPLPFISSGGSSLIASFMMIGIILSVADADKREARSLQQEREKRRGQLRILSKRR